MFDHRKVNDLNQLKLEVIQIDLKPKVTQTQIDSKLELTLTQSDLNPNWYKVVWVELIQIQIDMRTSYDPNPTRPGTQNYKSPK